MGQTTTGGPRRRRDGFLRALMVSCLGLLSACGGGPQRDSDDFDDPIEIPAAPLGIDVVEHLARYRVGDEARVQAYAEALEGSVRKPWTVERLAAAYASTLNAERREALAYLLAASRHETGLRAAGNALYDRAPNVGLAAAEGIEMYWMEKPVTEGGSARLGRAVLRWWNERKAALEANERSRR